MRTTPIAWLSIVAAALVAATSVAHAGKPTAYVFEGCVVDRLMISATGSYLRPMRFDPSPWEGKRIKLPGKLLPGDLFVPDARAIEVVGACDLQGDKRFKVGLIYGQRSAAEGLLEKGKTEDALRRVNAALKLDASRYFLYLLRARVQSARKRHDLALRDAQTGRKLAKGKYQVKWADEVLDRTRKAAAKNKPQGKPPR